MKRKILIILLSIMSAVCLCIGFAACDLFTNTTNLTDEHTHTLTHYEENAATETTDGNTEYWYCSGCGKYFSDSNGKTEISQSETVIPATGTGSTDSGSSGSGGSSTEGGSTEENPSAHTHTLIHTEKTDATCSQEGNTEYWYCSDCKKYFSDESGTTEITLADTVIEKLAHTVVVDSAVAATCTSTGLTEGSHCSVCGTVIVAQEVTEKSEHTVVVDSAVAATCTSTGLTEGSHCSVCNTVIVAQEVTEKLEHTVVTDEAVAATCTSTGLTEGNHCSVCNTVIVAQKVTEKLEHTYNGYSYDDNKHWQVCTVCEEQTEAEDHTYGSDNICTVCGMKKTSEGLKYTLSDDETYYTVSGIGECTDTDIVIPSTYNELPVKAIGSDAFYRCTSLTSVTIGNSVTSIGYYAFFRCESLTSVTIGNGVTSIGESAFYDCYLLTSITIGNGVISIGSSAFDYCSSLKNVYYNGTASQWANISFGGYDANPLRYAGNLYINGKLLTDLQDTDITTISEYAFAGWNVTSITIPNSVTSIGDSAFYNTAYYNDSSNWEDGVLYIGNYLIEADTSISGDYTIKEGTIAIADYAFYECTSLTSVTIPDSVTSIGSSAFFECSSLTSITVDNGNKYYKSIDGNLYSYDGSKLIQYAIGKTDTTFTIPDDVTSIGNSAFNNCTSLTSITIPDSVTSIGDYAFYYCTSLKSITISDSVTSIGSYAFYVCSSLTSITIPDSVTSIGSYAFYVCESLTSVTIGNGVTSIGDYAFYYCTSLISITISDSVTSIGRDAFESCYLLTSLTIGNGVTSIDYSAFAYCYSLTNITIPDSVTSIGNYAFKDCTSLTSVIIGSGVTSIGNYAFYYCDSLASVYYNGTEEEWNNISLSDTYSDPTYYGATLYYYSESEPTQSGNYWHYVDGVATVWE